MPNQYGTVGKVARVCQHCGETFHRYPSELIREGSGRYCSRSCTAKSRTGGRNPKWRGGTANHACEACGNAFAVSRYRTSRNEGKFCSPECRHAGQVRRVTRTCVACGESFERRPSELTHDRGHFCSRDCTNRGRALGLTRHALPGRDYTCKECGKVFHDQINNATGGRQFCSMRCRGAYDRRTGRRRGPNSHHWKGGARYPRVNEMVRPEYKEWRKAVFHRDKYICQECGAKGVYVQAHHIVRWVDAPALRYDVANGQTLCVPCHKKKHW